MFGGVVKPISGIVWRKICSGRPIIKNNNISVAINKNNIYFANYIHSHSKMTPSPLTPGTSTSSTPKKPVLLTISVDGNISSGKSTLVSSLSELLPKDFNYDVQIVPEPLEKWTNLDGHNLLGLLYQDTAKNNFLFQHYVQLTRLDDTVKTARQLKARDGFSGKIRILERSLQNNRYCFSELARRQGTLHEAEFAVLAEWYNFLEQHVDLTLDLIIYLRTSPQVVFDRMNGRGRVEESTVPLEYLSNLHETYEDWLVRKNIAEEETNPVPENRTSGVRKVIVIDANKSKEEVAIQTRHSIEEFINNYKRNLSMEKDRVEPKTSTTA